MESSLIKLYLDHALMVASDAHRDQLRADNETLYIVHPKEVGRRAAAHIREVFAHYPVELIEILSMIGAIGGVVHDVREDQPTYPLEAELLKKIPKEIVDTVMFITALLTNSGGDYLDYLLRLKLAGATGNDYAIIALIIKEEDMNANIDDTATIPSKGRRKAAVTKYLLAHWILFERKPYALLPIRPEYSQAA